MLCQQYGNTIMVVLINIGVFLATYLMTVLSSSYGIIMDRAINAPGHEKNVVDGLNATENIL